MFFTNPPGKNASVKDWQTWLESEKRSEAAAKASETKKLEHGDCFDALPSEAICYHSAKIGGAHSQVSAFVGGTEESVELEIGVNGTQEKMAIISQWELSKRGSRSHTSKSGSSRYQRRKKLKRAKKAKETK